MSLNYRSNDAVFSICQDNNTKLITIIEVNKSAAELIGYSASDILGKEFASILPARIGELLTEYVEFEDAANDVGMVLSKVQSFSIVGKDGKEKGFRIKIARTDARGGSLSFALILQDAVVMRKDDAVRKVISESFKGHEALDGRTNLPNKSSLIKDIGVVKRYNNNNNNLSSCFAILQIDKYDELVAQHGKVICENLYKHVAFTAKRSLRPDDIIGVISDNRVGILLVDAMKDSTRIVFNRLRWQIAANPYILADKSTVGLSVSIGFSLINGDSNENSIIDNCEKALESLASGAGNILVEA